MRFASLCALVALATSLGAVKAAPSAFTDAATVQDVLLDARQLNVLTAGGTLSKGKKCSTSGQCKTKLYCNKSKCDSILGVGASCYKNVGCTSNSCDLKIGKCLGAIGETCKASTTCASGYCGNSKCAAKAAVGEKCYKNVGCTSNVCTAGKCAASSTTPPNGGGGGGGSGVSTLKPVPAHVTRLDDFSNGLGSWTSKGSVKVITDVNGDKAVQAAATAQSASFGRDIPASAGKKRDDAVFRRQTYNSYTVQFTFQYQVLPGAVLEEDEYLGCGISAQTNRGYSSSLKITKAMVGASSFALGKVSYVDKPPNDGSISRVDIITSCSSSSSATVNIKDIQFAYTDASGSPVDGSVAPPASVARPEQHENLLGASAGFENNGGDWYVSGGNAARVSFAQTSLARRGGWAAQMNAQPTESSGDQTSIVLNIAGNPPSGTLPYSAWLWYRITDKKDRPSTACERGCRPYDYSCSIDMCVFPTTGQLSTMGGNMCSYLQINSPQYDRYELFSSGPGALMNGDSTPAAPRQMYVAFSCNSGVESATILLDDVRLQYEGSGADTVRPTTPAASSATTNLIKNPTFTSTSDWVVLDGSAAVQASSEGGNAFVSQYNDEGVPELTQYVSGLVGGATYKLETKYTIQSFDSTNAISNGGLSNPGCTLRAQGMNQIISTTPKYFATSSNNQQLTFTGTYVHDNKFDPLPLNYQLVCDAAKGWIVKSRVNIYSVSLTRTA